MKKLPEHLENEAFRSMLQMALDKNYFLQSLKDENTILSVPSFCMTLASGQDVGHPKEWQIFDPIEEMQRLNREGQKLMAAWKEAENDYKQVNARFNRLMQMFLQNPANGKEKIPVHSKSASNGKA